MAENMSKRTYLILLISGLFIIAVFFWNTPFMYPVKIFTVILHELGHGLAAVISGGGIERIEISPQIGGVCYTRGGSQILIVSAGYLGSLIAGCAIMLIAARTSFDRILSFSIGLGLITLVIFYIRTGFGIWFGLLMGVALMVVARYASNAINEIVMLFFGFTSALYAVIDIKEDLISRTVPGSDAYALSKIIPLPPVVWGVLWIALAVMCVFITLRIALKAK